MIKIPIKIKGFNYQLSKKYIEEINNETTIIIFQDDKKDLCFIDKNIFIEKSICYPNDLILINNKWCQLINKLPKTLFFEKNIRLFYIEYNNNYSKNLSEFRENIFKKIPLINNPLIL